ncbi:hypothetical protein ACHQM5_019646 [Ranunculus cassubicifolius]
MKSVAICVVMVLAVLQLVQPGQAIECPAVDSCLAQCVPFLIGGAGPTPACCKGVQSLKDMAVTHADKTTACNCVKQAAAKVANIKPDAVSSLPTKCGIPFSFPVSVSTDCSNIPLY